MRAPLLTAACIALAAHSAAAQPQITIDDLSAPTSPAFSLLGVTPSSVERPDNPKLFVVNLVNKIASATGGLPDNYAMEVAPYWLASHPKLTFQTYQRPGVGQSLAQSFLLSVATTPIPGATSSEDPLGTRLGLGFRAFVRNGRPSAALEGLVSQIVDVDFEINDLVHREGLPGTSEEERKKLIEQEQQKRDEAESLAAQIEAADSERVGFFLAVAGGQTWAFTGDDFSAANADKFGFWVTPSYRFKGCDETSESCISSIDVIAVARVLTEKGKDDRWDAGGRFVLRANKELYVSFEALGRRDNNQPATSDSRNFRSVGMVEYRIDKDIILYGSFGRDFKKDNGVAPLVSLFGLNLGFGTKPVLTADKAAKQ
jgi:hypothetical protein